MTFLRTIISSFFAVFLFLQSGPLRAQEEILFGFDLPPLGALPAEAFHIRNTSNLEIFFYLSLNEGPWTAYKLVPKDGALVRSNRGIMALATSTDAVVEAPSLETNKVSQNQKNGVFDIFIISEGDRAEICWSGSENAWVTQTQTKRRC